MKFKIVKEPLMNALADFSEIISRKSTVPILSHLFIEAKDQQLILKGTDTEVSLQANIDAEVFSEGAITIPGGKFLDIIRHLTPNSDIECLLEEAQFVIKSSDSHFCLTTLPAEDFPVAEALEINLSIQLNSTVLNNIMQKVKFSMANQDVRYYLNGLFLKAVENGQALQAVTTDGHRLSCAQATLETAVAENTQLLIPKKGVQELLKMLARVDRDVTLNLSDRQLQLDIENYQFSTRLIDGQFPDYESVLPEKQAQPVLLLRQTFLQALQRARVLLIDRHDGVRLRFEGHKLYLSARNLENETSEEALEIINPAEIHLETSLNINYLIDSVSALDSENIQLHFKDSDSACLISSQQDQNVRYVIMPMRL